VIRPIKPRPQPWMNMSIGRTGFNLTAIASLWNSETESYSPNEIRAQVEMHGDRAKDYFNALQMMQDEIDADLAFPVDWVNLPDKVSCKIVTKRTVNLFDENDWNNQCAWLLSSLEELHRVFAPRIAAF